MTSTGGPGARGPILDALNAVLAAVECQMGETKRLRRRSDEQFKVVREIQRWQKKAAEAARQKAIFEATDRARRQFQDPESCEARRYVQSNFSHEFAEVVDRTQGLGEAYVVFAVAHYGRPRSTGGNVHAILSSLPPDPYILGRFIQTMGGYPCDPLEKAERVLTDVEAIALPCSLGHKWAWTLAETYTPEIEATAPSILPYVAIQMRLRGDVGYQSIYLDFLSALRIDPNGWVTALGGKASHRG